jgi:hypothetical protein
MLIDLIKLSKGVAGKTYGFYPQVKKIIPGLDAPGFTQYDECEEFLC